MACFGGGLHSLGLVAYYYEERRQKADERDSERIRTMHSRCALFSESRCPLEID